MYEPSYLGLQCQTMVCNLDFKLFAALRDKKRFTWIVQRAFALKYTFLAIIKSPRA